VKKPFIKIAIMQPYLFPHIGYWQLLQEADRFVILDDVNYIKKGWINRNRIIVNGKEHLFTAPIKCASQNKLIKDIGLSDRKWKYKFVKTLEYAYKKAPFFNQSFGVIRDCLMNSEQNLSKYILNSIFVISKYLDIDVQIIESSSLYGNQYKSQDKIIDICIKEGATSYINSIGGANLYSHEMFDFFEIELNFLKYKEGLSHLSIIDVLMKNSPDDIKKMITQYELS
jgi:hypothetical protein